MAAGPAFGAGRIGAAACRRRASPESSARSSTCPSERERPASAPRSGAWAASRSKAAWESRVSDVCLASPLGPSSLADGYSVRAAGACAGAACGCRGPVGAELAAGGPGVREPVADQHGLDAVRGRLALGELGGTDPEPRRRRPRAQAPRGCRIARPRPPRTSRAGPGSRCRAGRPPGASAGPPAGRDPLGRAGSRSPRAVAHPRCAPGRRAAGRPDRPDPGPGSAGGGRTPT